MSLDLSVSGRYVRTPTALYGSVEKIAVSFWARFPTGATTAQYGRIGSFASSSDAWSANNGILLHSATAGTGFPRDITCYQGNNTAPGATSVTATGFVQDTWYHFGLMNDREDGTDFYVNGSLIGRSLGLRNNTATGYLGLSNWGGAQFIGMYVAELAVWLETTLSGADFVSLAGAASPLDFPTGLESYWPLRDSARDAMVIAPSDPTQNLEVTGGTVWQSSHPAVPAVPEPVYDARTIDTINEFRRSVSRPAKNLIESAGAGAAGKARGAKLDPGIG